MSATLADLLDAIEEMDYDETRSYTVEIVGIKRPVVLERKRIFAQLDGTALQPLMGWANNNGLTSWVIVSVYNSKGSLLDERRFHSDRRAKGGAKELLYYIVDTVYEVPPGEL